MAAHESTGIAAAGMAPESFLYDAPIAVATESVPNVCA